MSWPKNQLTSTKLATILLIFAHERRAIAQNQRNRKDVKIKAPYLRLRNGTFGWHKRGIHETIKERKNNNLFKIRVNWRPIAWNSLNETFVKVFMNSLSQLTIP
jgi:hypothetical protein